jgi:hypothetical protein
MSCLAPQLPTVNPVGVRNPNSALRKAAAYLIASLICLLPCFWQERIQASDLSSHLYNAWLANLIAQHHLTGLHLVRLSNNVEFDWVLSTLLPLFGLNWTTRLAVGAAVLLFFWSAFAFVRALSRRDPWPITPWLFAITYGIAFQAGLFNFYISTAWSLLALAFVWNRTTRASALAVPLFVLAWLAHPLPVAVAASLLICERIARVASLRVRYVLLGLAAVVLVAILVATHQHFPARAPLFATGATEMVFFSRSYYIASALFLAVAGILLLANWRELKRFAVEPFAMTYGLCLLIVCLAPEEIDLHGTAPLTLIGERLTIFSGLLLCAIVMRLRPKAVHVAGFAIAALSFFGLFYRDTAKLNAMEDSVEQAIHTLPPYQRVVSAIKSRPNRGSNHLLDRACIGYCYSYANYEPATNQFRIRAQQGNPYVLHSFEETSAAEVGQYRVKAQDLPLYAVTECEGQNGRLCTVSLTQGDLAGADMSWKPF